MAKSPGYLFYPYFFIRAPQYFPDLGCIANARIFQGRNQIAGLMPADTDQ
jgi:hypothetical protein